MPAKKPRSLNRRHDTNADKAARAAGESAATSDRPLPMAAPAALADHPTAAAAWRRLMREYEALEGQLVTRLDLDLLVDYCLLTEQALELDRMRRVAYQTWLELAKQHDALEAQHAQIDELAAAAIEVVGAFDAVLKLDARADRKRTALQSLRQALYLTPRSRAGVAPQTKAPPEPEDPLERLLRDVDLDGRNVE